MDFANTPGLCARIAGVRKLLLVPLGSYAKGEGDVNGGGRGRRSGREALLIYAQSHDARGSNSAG